MKLLSRIALLIAAALFLGAGSARADTMLFFSITGPTTATFELPTHPTVNPYKAASDDGFLITPINLTIDGTPSDAFVAFYLDPNNGALAILNSTVDDVIALTGIQLFSGSPFYPVFAAHGPVVLSDAYTGDPAYTLTIGENPPAVPEPSTMLLLAAGLLPLGLLAKRLL
jgi:hypothetical protein